MKPYIVLDIYKPKRWDARLIGLDLCTLTGRKHLLPHPDSLHGPLSGAAWHNTILHAEVRRRTFRTKMAEDWHYDGDTTPGANPNCAIVLWASNNPTQIKHRIVLTEWDGRDITDTAIYQPRPYEVVIFRNLSCLHRRPPGCPRIRWVFRQRVIVPARVALP